MTATHFLAGLILVGTAAALTIPDASISGPARVIDGDTIEINHQRVRLWGIDAPEHDQPQGPAATHYLQRMLANGTVTCSIVDKDRYHRVVAKCADVGGDIGRRMVATGHAVDYAHYSHGYYRDEEQAAREEHLGIWSGPTFIRPDVWRHTAHKPLLTPTPIHIHNTHDQFRSPNNGDHHAYDPRLPVRSSPGRPRRRRPQDRGRGSRARTDANREYP